MKTTILGHFLQKCTFARPKKPAPTRAISAAQGFLDFRSHREAKKPCAAEMAQVGACLLDPPSAHEAKNGHFWQFFAKMHFRDAKKTCANPRHFCGARFFGFPQPRGDQKTLR
ncbi:MAG: hypothetical protein GY755_22390, partial [Chloroflexi bacterium]|nr:hypothetical protein [Chloroflexota bacterium]